MSESPPPPHAVTRIGQIAISVTDVQRATRFYRDVLGFRFLFEAGGMSFLECGGVRILLGLPEDESIMSGRNRILLYVFVDDIHSTVVRLEENGAIFKEQPHQIAKLEDREVWLAFFTDSEGNLVGLMSEVLV
jgi:methylmalonyl-CoA/ethylmalonyl-CoA epimerase